MKRIYKIMFRANVGEDCERTTWVYSESYDDCYDSLGKKMMSNDEFLEEFGEIRIKSVREVGETEEVLWTF